MPTEIVVELRTGLASSVGSGRRDGLLAASTRLVAAYVSNNSVPAGNLSTLITSVHEALAMLGQAQSTEMMIASVEQPTPLQVRKSIQKEGLVSFIDGKTYKTLKRHLTSHGLDPRAYRDRYGLPADYPMVAPAYAEQRSQLAKAIGLGVPGSRRSS